MEEIRRHFDSVAEDYDRYKNRNRYYYGQITKFYQQIIPPGSRVLEIGSATGELLAAVRPAYGLGIDISANMVRRAQKKYPHLNFVQGTISELPSRDDFDYIILSNLIDYSDNIYLLLENLKNWSSERTRIIITNINPLWAPLVRLAAKLWLRASDTRRNFVTLLDICNLLEVLGYDISERGFRLAIPVYLAAISYLINKIIPRIYGIKNLSFMQYVVCRKRQDISKRDSMSCSIVVPCHNEEGNIEECVRRIPDVGTSTEILIVDDGSTDNTAGVAHRISRIDKRVAVIRIEKNLGKGNAVRAGFDRARGDILIILDADMSVMPEDIPKFFNAIADGAAEFVNGTRMVYPIEKQAMKFLNYLGNKMFGIITSIIMGQRNTDTLCGTKALLRKDYYHIGIKDCQWGDFDLLYGAARLRLKMLEMPVNYRRRIRGSSKMRVFKHGLGIMRSCWEMFWGLA